MVVDDEPSIREALSEFLEEKGYDVIQAENGRNALALLERAGRPCLIFLDLMMPLVNGHQVLEALHRRKDRNQLKVAIITASRVREVSTEDPLVVAYLTKPFSLEQIESVLGECDG